jgi:hypothetical protein
MGTKKTKSFDKQLNQAWFGFRMQLASSFADEVEVGQYGLHEITTEAGKSLSIEVDDRGDVVIDGDECIWYPNIHEAAHRVYEILHEEWQTIHPAFVTTDLIEWLKPEEQLNDLFVESPREERPQPDHEPRNGEAI